MLAISAGTFFPRSQLLLLLCVICAGQTRAESSRRRNERALDDGHNRKSIQWPLAFPLLAILTRTRKANHRDDKARVRLSLAHQANELIKWRVARAREGHATLTSET